MYQQSDRTLNNRPNFNIWQSIVSIRIIHFLQFNAHDLGKSDYFISTCRSPCPPSLSNFVDPLLPFKVVALLPFKVVADYLDDYYS